MAAYSVVVMKAMCFWEGTVASAPHISTLMSRRSWPSSRSPTICMTDLAFKRNNCYD